MKINNCEVKTDEVKYVAPYTFLWHLPGHGYVIENQTPGNWQMSQSFGTKWEAIEAFENDLIVWTDEGSET